MTSTHYNISRLSAKRLPLLFLILFISINNFGQTYRIDTLDSQTVETCSGTFYDSGAGAGDYTNNENYTVTFSSTGGERITFNFTSFNLRNEGGDTLKVYNGSSVSEPLLGTYTGEGLSFAVQSTDTSLTFQFTSDGSLVNSGWEAIISCCPIPTTSSITGSDEECIYSSGITYSVTNTPGSTYDWIITGGTQSGGGTSNSITVNWGSTPGAARVCVVEDNGCTLGDTVTLDVTLYDLPAVSFSGLDSVYDINLDGPVTLTGSPPGGTFTGNGISGDQFDPAAAGLGDHTIVYSYTDLNGCTNTDTNYTSVRDYDDYSGARFLADIDNWCSADAAYSNGSASGDMSPGSCWTGGTGDNIWFKFIATTNAVKVDVITGGSFGAMRGQQIAIWNASNDEVACGNSADWYTGTLSVSMDTLTAGHYYWISVDDRRTHGTFTLCIDDTAGYDFKSGAVELADISNWCSADAAYQNTYTTPDESPGSCWTGGSANNVWFTFTATTQAVKVDVITGGSYGSMRGQQIAIWNSEGTEVKCINGADWYAGTLSLSIDTLTIGHNYWISVDDRRTHGTFTLCIDNEVDYDYKSGAFEITDIDGYVSADAEFDNVYATPDESAGSCWTGGTGNNVWFSFVASSPAVTISVVTGGSKGSMRGQQIALWNSAGEEIKCANAADWFAGTLTCEIDTLSLGRTYYISVDDRRTHGSFTLEIDDEVGYDFKAGAELILDVDNWCSADAAYDNVYATPDQSAGSCWTGGTGNNVWFKFVAISGEVLIEVKTGGSYGSMRGQQIALWNEAGVEVGCINGADWYAGTLSLSSDTLTSGRTYYISVDDRRTHGTFTLCINNKAGFDFKSGAILIPPINDWCSNDAAYNNTYATADQSAGSCWTGGTGNNVWFKFVAPTSAVTIDVITGGASGSMRGQQIALWTEGLTEAGCVNGADWYAGTLTFSIDTLTINNTYYISVDDRRTHGTFSLCVDYEQNYDYKSGAYEITSIDNWCSSDAQFNNTYASPDESAGSCWTGGTNNNVWFKFTSTTASVNIDVITGGSYGTMRGQQIALWNSEGVEVKCINGADWYAGTLSLSVDTLTPGHDYWISVDDRRTHGSFTLCIDDIVSNDYKSGALELVDLVNWCSADAAYNNTYATPDESAGTCWTGGTNNNLWYKFDAVTNSIKIDVKTGGSYGSMRGQQIALWTEDGIQAGCANAADWYAGILSLSIDTLTIGNTYYISVDDRRTHGTFTLCVTNTPDYNYKSGAYELTNLNSWQSSDAQFSNTYATPDESAGSCWTGGTANNVWFKFDALFDSLTVDVITGGASGSMRGQQIAVWTSDGIEAGCVNGPDWYAGTLSLTVDTLTPGNTYYISVDDRRTHGTFTLAVNNTSNVQYWAIADGNWNDPNTWSNSEGGSPAASYPTQQSVVHIKGYNVTVVGTESAAIYLEVENSTTSLIVDADTLHVNGSVTFINNGSNYDGFIIVRNAGGLDIDDDFIINRAGGANEFSVTVEDNSYITVGNDLNISSSAGTTEDTEFTLNGTSTLQVAQDINLTYTGGQRILMQLNTSAALTALGDITFTSSAQNQVEIELNNNTILDIAANFVRGATPYGILDGNDNSTVSFNSTQYIQVIPQNTGAGTDDFTYRNITINNSRITSPQISVEGDVSVPGTLTLTDGIVQTTSSNLLTLENTASVAGGSSGSYIKGPVEKIGNTSFTFPIGKDDIYKPLSISAPSNITDAFQAEYFYENPDPTYDVTLKEATIDNVSTCEYWVLDRTVGASNVTVTIGWDGSSCCINDLGLLKVVAWNGAQWTDLGNGGTTGDLSAGTITSSSNVTNNNNPVTFGDPLPVVDFSGLAGPYCESDGTVALTGSPQNANGTFSGPGVTDNSDGTGTFDPATAGDGTHDITYTYNNPVSGCSGINIQSVTVNQIPSATLSGTDTICSGSSTSLSAYFTGQSDWTFKYTNTYDTTEVTTSQNPYTFLISDSGTYRIIEITDGNGCAGIDFGSSAPVGFYPEIPTPTIDTVGNIPFCDNDTLLLISSGGGLFSLWSNGETTDTINVTESDDYFVNIVDANYCVSELSDTVSVVVYRIPRKPLAISGSTSICQDGPDTYYSTYSQYASTYIWELYPVAAGSISGTGTTGTVNWDAVFNGTAKIVAKGENVDCGIGETSDTLYVTVSAYPGQSGTPSGTDTLLIDSPDTDYTTSGATGATSYTWNISPVAAGSISGTGTTGTVDWDNSWTGTAYITVRGENACGSGTWSDTLAVVILSNPSVSFAGATLSGLESISPVQFIVSLSYPVPVDVSFDYTTADGTAINGVGNDYETASGNTTISAGETTDTILVTVYNDATEESNETFTLTLSGFVNSVGGTDTVITYTILDNDGLGWIGPGGVGNLSDQMNVWHSTYYSSNLSDGQKVSTNPNQWDDLSTNNVDAYQGNASYQPTFYDVAPVWNGRPLIQFDNSNNEYLIIGNNVWMNTAAGAQTKRTIIIAFRSGNDISSRQVLFEEGGGSRGLNVYIENDSVYMGGWNIPNDDGGATTPWQYSCVKTEISQNSPYFGIFQLEYGAGSGEIRGSLNGTDLGITPNVGTLFPHSGDIGIGGMNQGSCFDDGSCPGGNNYFFVGDIAEFSSGNVVYNQAELKIVHNYLAAKYGISLPGGEDLYDYDLTHNYEVIGIGQVDASNSHNFAQGKSIIRIENPSNIGDGKFIFAGHDDGDISSWINSEVPNNDVNIVRLTREWRVDKQGGDIGTIDIIVDTSQFGSYSADYSAYVILIDDDGDFTSGSRSIELQDAGAGYLQSAGTNFIKGEYFTFARVKPAIEFSLVSSDGMEDIGTAGIAIRMNYASGSDVTVEYQSANGTADKDQVPVGDYNELSGTFTLTAGDTSGTITLTINNDAIVESDETLTITLSNPSPGTNLGDNTVHTFTIHDDDNSRKVQFTAQANSGDESISPVIIDLHLTENNPTNPVDVDYNILASSTATNGGVDFTLTASGTVTFGVNDTLESLSAVINDDAINENTETIVIEISNPVNANLGDTTVYTYGIIDNDPEPEVYFTVTSASGAESYSPHQLVLKLSSVSGNDVQVDHTVTGGSAQPAGIDFTLTDGTATIPAGEDSIFLLLYITDDGAQESNENLEITLSNPVNATLGDDSVFTYTIADDDNNIGWIGPGGVGNLSDQINVWHNTYYSTNLSDGDKVSTNPNQWDDLSVNDIDAFQDNASNQPTFYDISPVWNERPIIRFNSGENEYLKIADNQWMNTASGAQTKRTIIITFRPGTDISSRQVVFEEGGGSRGLNIYIENDTLYIGGWNLPNDDGGQTTPWPYTSVKSEITANTPYFAIMQFDFDDVLMTGEVRGSLNGIDLGTLPGAGKLFPHGNDIGVGAMNQGACFDDGSCPGGVNYYFDGYIAEFISGNMVYNEAALKIVHNYLAAKYGVNLPGGEDIYDYESAHSYELFGMGQVDAGNFHNYSQGYGIIKIENPGNIGDNKFILIGHDNGDISNWVGTDVPGADTNIVRVTREWRVDKQGGDIGTIDMTIDSSQFGSYYSSYSKFVLLIDNDGDFTSGSRSIELQNAGPGLYKATGVNFTKGEYFTIARIRPAIEFILSESDGNEDDGTADIAIRMNYAAAADVTIDYQSTDGTADKDQLPIGDYNELSGTFTLSAGDTSGTITLTINNDAVIESDETLTIDIYNPSSGINLGGNTIHTFTIHDDDNSRKVQFTAQADSGDESSTPVTINLHLTENNPSNPVDVDYDILAGSTATNGGVDYTLAASGTVTFGVNDTLENLSVTINDDAVDEDTETIIIELSNPVNANLGDTTIYTYSIIDNDSEPEVYFSTTSASGAESYSPVQLIIKLTATSGKDIQVDHTVTGGTAQPGGVDFTLADGTATIPAGEDSVILYLSIFNDIAEESNEDLEITLSNPVNAVLGDDSVFTHTIIDDDGLGWLGPGGVGNFSTQIGCWLRTTTAPGLSDGEKVSTDPDNWKDQTGNGNHAFQSNASNQPTFWDISPTWNDRPLIEFDRSSSNFLDIADNAFMNTPSGAQTKRTIIVAFRPANNISNRQVIFEEGATVRGLNIYIEQDSLYIGGWNDNNDDGGATTPWPYTYVSSEISTNTPYFAILQFDFDDLLGTGEVRGSLNGIDLGQLPGAGKLFPHSGDIGIGGQSDGACYKGGSCQGGDNNFFDGHIAELISGNIVFNNAQLKIVHNYLATKYNISLPGGDDIYDYDAGYGYELFGIGQENTSNSHYIAQGSGIIRVENPSASGDGKYLMIGHDGADIDDWKEYDEMDVPNNDPNIQRVERVWRVDKEGGDLGSVSVRLDTTDLPVKSFGYTKYVLITDNDGDFTLGARTIGLVHDGQQYHSTGNINFTTGDFFTIGIVKPAVEFYDTASNDTEPVTSIDPAQPEFIVKLNYEASEDVTVNYATSNGTAIAGSDYTAESSSVTISAGDTTATFNISIINDTDIENDEDFQITLSNPPAGVQIGTNSVHTFTINDDDNPRKVEFTVATGSGDEGTTPVTVEVSINLVDAFNYTRFDYTVTGGTATEGAGNDFILADGTDSIAPGSNTINLPAITIYDDLYNENDETFIITLSNPVNANLGTNTTYTYTIQDNDGVPTVQFDNTTENGAESYNPAGLLVRLSAISGKDITVEYNATDITATGGGIDYTLSPGILTIPAGDDSAYIWVDIFNDIIEESTETFSVTLSNPSNATLGANQVVTYSIYDDDGMGYVGPGGVGYESQYLAWLDANRETYANGANVTTFNDQSGNSNEATAPGGNEPTFSQGAINNRHVLYFNGSSDYMNIANTNDINTSSAAQTLRTLLMAFRTGASVAGRQVLYEEGGGTRGLNIYIDNGNLYVGGWNLAETPWGFTDVNQPVNANSVYYVMFEMNQLAGIFRGYLNGNLMGDSIDVGALYAHSGDISIGRNGGSRFHDGTSSTAWYFNGEIMEFLTYNYVLNDAQKKIVENYFASKYRNEIETGMANDMYSYRVSHGYELFGLGQEDASNTHIISQGTGIVRTDNPTDLDDGDYIFIGHDNKGISAWIIDSVPYDSIQRIRRNWKVDENGDISDLRIAVDTTVLPSKPAYYDSYVLMVDANTDADSDMSTNPQDVTINPMSIKSGSLRMVNNIALSAGDIFTIGVARNRTIQNGNWNDNSTWLLNRVPEPGETALITPGDTIDLVSDVTIYGVVIGNTSVLNLNSHEFTLTGATLINNGTLNIGTSTFNYGGTIDQCIEPLAYYNLTVSGTGTKTLCGDISIANDLLILGAPATLTLDVDAANNYSIDIAGNWQNTASFNAQDGTVNLNGTNQSIENTTGTEIFNVLNIQTSSTLTLVSNISVSDTIYMDGGNISTGTQKLTVGTGIGEPGTITRNSGYIIGNLERWIVNNNSYEFPIGTSAFYRPATIQFSNVTAGGSLQIGFDTTNPGNFGLPINESGLYVVDAFTEGYWIVDEINAITFTGGFDIDLAANGFTSFSIGAGTRVIARPNDLSDWVFSGTHVDAVGITVQRDAVTMLPSELACGDTSLCDVDANVSSNDITCNGANDGTITISGATGGSGVYEYTITGVGGWQASGNFTGLSQSTYDVRIRDANNITCEEVLDGSLDINEPPPVVPTITGSDTLCQGTTEIYTTEGGMANYDWEVSAGGTIMAGGDGNNSITVRWDDIEGQTISIDYEDGGCSPAAPTVLDVWILKLPDTGPGYHIENGFNP